MHCLIVMNYKANKFKANCSVYLTNLGIDLTATTFHIFLYVLLVYSNQPEHSAVSRRNEQARHAGEVPEQFQHQVGHVLVAVGELSAQQRVAPLKVGVHAQTVHGRVEQEDPQNDLEGYQCSAGFRV